ncbi:MAG: SMC-Scp complex subunit ScpB [Candidatus Omnitrophica bacterium]|nr:SMC-Scp complex subunit ScpB [Candidatus Omnitrophota bacterium]MDD5354989.1 SMC-Scp complex subunit ScpB [Candidatus Omnitrophota bacterium]
MADINPELKGAIESLIFISEGPSTIVDIQNILEGLDSETIRAAIEELKNEYEKRNSGIKIMEVAGGYQMVTSPNYVNFVKKFYKIKHAEKLTLPALETLSIIAYKQPVTKLEIELIRGVNVDGVLKNLLEKGLVRIVGRKEVIGRPFVYGTTRSFLEYFGLNSLEELPAIENFIQALSEREMADITPIGEEDIQEASSQENSKPPSEETAKEAADINNNESINN